MYEKMNTQTSNSFEQRIKQSTGNHKPNRYRKSHSKEPNILTALKLKMVLRKAQNKHKRVISQARKRRGVNIESNDSDNIVLNETNDTDNNAYLNPEDWGY